MNGPTGRHDDDEQLSTPAQWHRELHEAAFHDIVDVEAFEAAGEEPRDLPTEDDFRAAFALTELGDDWVLPPGPGGEAPRRVPRGAMLMVLLIVLIFALVAGGFVLANRDDTTAGATAAASVAASAPGGGDAAAAEPSPTSTDAPIPDALAKSWVSEDGTMGYEFGSDGTYTSSTAQGSTAGRFRVADESGVQQLMLLDPGDPSGGTTLLTAEYQLDADTLTLTVGGTPIRFVPGDLPDQGTVTAPVAIMDAAAASTAVGRVNVTVDQAADGTRGLFTQEVELSGATGRVTIDGSAGQVSGGFQASYTCRDSRCTDPGESAQAVVDVEVLTAQPSTCMKSSSAIEGQVRATVDMTATSLVSGKPVAWSWQDSVDGTYCVGLESTYAVFDMTLPAPGTGGAVTLQLIAPTSAP